MKGCTVQKYVLFEILHFFIILWDLVKFSGEIQTTSKSNFYAFYSRTILLRGAYCKNEYFLRYCTYLLWDLASFLRLNSDYFQIKFLQFLWGKWTILRLFY